jgi:uncharacterized DUF497 family protein
MDVVPGRDLRPKVENPESSSHVPYRLDSGFSFASLRRPAMTNSGSSEYDRLHGIVVLGIGSGLWAQMAAFEWDEAKNAANVAKHGISFEEAATIFEGPVLSSDDAGSDDEVRERSYGLLNGIVVVCVIHTQRGAATRIISARKATKQERTLFHAYLQKARR